MSHRLAALSLALTLTALLGGCGAPEQASAPTPPETTSEAPTETAATTLALEVNGEEIPQTGFTSADGWELSFEHIYVNFTEIQAHQTDPPYDYASLSPITEAIATVDFGTQMVDLITGNADNPIVPVVQIPDVEPGHYNAISWKMGPLSEGPAAGYSMVIVGQASRDGETIDFVLRVTEEFAFYCGDFVGDERKGIVEPGDASTVEATFHFDHLFGEGSLGPQDPLNVGAFGFDPLAALAVDGRIETDTAALATALAPDDLDRLRKALSSLGHAGEGHCFEAISGNTN